MTIIALAALGVLLVISAAFASIVRSLIRSHARERGLLIDQIMHLSGKTWTPPPADLGAPVEEFDPDGEPDDPRFETSPAQLPDY